MSKRAYLVLSFYLLFLQTEHNWVEPRAGNIGFVKIKFSNDVESFIKDVITEKGILLLPSTVYDFGNQHFRIGYGRRNFNEVMKRFEEYLIRNLL
ncbi:MAG: hypothetical protein ACW981_16230 [Candidatus Hodarchaeales archaeon]